MKGRTRETGETGELLVLAELYRREVLGGQAARGARGIDLLTSTGHTLQVKAKRGRGRWVLGREGRRPAADLVVLVSVGDQHADDEFFLIPVGVLYDWAEDRHRAHWATRPDVVSGERELMQIRDSSPDVREFLNPYRTPGSSLRTRVRLRTVERNERVLRAEALDRDPRHPPNGRAG